jgi:hypothetical protein
MVGGLVFVHAISMQVAVAFMIVSAALFIGTIYGWLTSPLE